MLKPLKQYHNQVWDHCFFLRTPKVWNQLPESLISAKDLQTFRIRLKKFDLNKILKTDHD